MHLKVFVKLKKNLKTLSSGQKKTKKPKKPKKPKNPKKTTGLGFFLTGFFPTLAQVGTVEIVVLYSGVNSDPDKESMGSLDPDPDSQSGSESAKMTHKNIKS
jgi:hypothetical protein